MPQGETGKQRATRIPLDYYKKPDRIVRWKLRLTLLALVASVGWLIGGMAFGGRSIVGTGTAGRLRASHGELARVHSTWEARCEACHAPFQPISEPARAWTKRIGLDGKANDAKCQQCHNGPVHHENAYTKDVVSCAGCHRDHKGRENSLVSMADGDCTRCHSDLTAHTDLAATPSGKPSNYANVNDFNADHPEFRALTDKAGDPGRLKFNHAFHLNPGMPAVKDGKPTIVFDRASVDPAAKDDKKPRPLFTFGDLPEADRARYGWEQGDKLDAPVTLDCASCHRLDAADFDPDPADSTGGWRRGLPSGVLPARASGAYFQPITYENQCKACHPIQVPTYSDDPTSPNLTVRHRLQPDDLYNDLVGGYVGKLLNQADAPAPKAETGRRDVPGRRWPEELEAEAASLREAVADRVLKAERRLFSGVKSTCTECHYYEYEGDKPAKPLEVPRPPAVPEDPKQAHDSLTATQFPKLKVAPTNVKAVWFDHAKFDHSAHRAVSCRECHASAYTSGVPDGKMKSTDRSHLDVLLPKIQDCRQCHAPASGSGESIVGGAGHSCTECHTYHNGPMPEVSAEGIGARERDADAELSIKDFLRGLGQAEPKK